MANIPPAFDPIWADEDYRTAYLNGLVAVHDLKTKELAHLTGVTRFCAGHWRSGRHRTIPTDTLRALAYDLSVGGIER